MDESEECCKDFDGWLEDNFDLCENFDDVVAIYRTLCGDSGWGYTVTVANGKARISSDYGLYPSLEVPEDEVDNICRKMDDLYGWPIDAEETFRHAMEKDD